MSDACTRGVRVQVASEYVPERSNPVQSEYFFAYHIRIANEGAETVQLLSRHWIITDAHGQMEEVQGPGVVGERPVLESGQSFEYTSACPLQTPYGSMRGSYRMLTEEGEAFDAEIAMFALSQPYAIN